jgi:hypothetical protein
MFGLPEIWTWDEKREVLSYLRGHNYRSYPTYPFFWGGGCEAIGTAATPGLLCQPRVIMKMIVEKQMECRLGGEIEVLRENLPQRHFCPSQNPTWPDPGLNPGRRGGKPATNRLRYGAAHITLYLGGGLWGYWHCGHSWPIVPASGHNKDDCGEADGM